ncbi:MAG: hypothetical protein KDA20_06050 [Phycisphaerales bacterium]|nr:hypothetical protein [Phycisphaerales bacterium]
MLWDRSLGAEYVGQQAAQEHDKALAEVMHGDFAWDILQSLLRDEDPKVRTLALVALFGREDPSDLQAIATLANDAELSFPGLKPISLPGGFPAPELSELLSDQTVGHFATEMLGLYGVRHAYGGVTQEEWLAYWEHRANRSHCLSWFHVQYERAHRGSHPIRGDAFERIKKVRERIDALERDERAWTLFLLYDREGSGALVTEDELLQLARELGRDKLERMLTYDLQSDDPDKKIIGWRHHWMMTFVLGHADQLLEPDDCDWLLERQAYEYNYRERNDSNPLLSPWWSIAAAQLQPDRARDILYSAIGHFQGRFDCDERRDVYVALWNLVGESEKFFIQEWFYNREPDVGCSSLGKQAEFIRDIAMDRSNAPLIAFLLDHRLGWKGLDWSAVESAARIVNKWAGEPIITEDELREAWHPLGYRSFAAYDSTPDHREETEALARLVDKWSRRLVQATPQWCPDYKR